MSAYHNKKVNKSVVQVPKSDIKLLWHHVYWDGPLNGACIYNNERLWFECFKEGSRHRKFVLLRLTKDQWEDIDFRHLKFQNYVGTHTDYDDNGCRRAWEGNGLRPLIESNHDKFYSWAKDNPLLDPDGEQVAWYRSPCNKN
jgi:hypothetical protein